MMLAILFLVSCASAEPPLPQPLPQPTPQRLTFAEHCTAIMNALGNPWIESWQKAAIYEKGKNDGCFGIAAPSPK